MNVLGVIFSSNLQWSEQVSKAILKANHALYATKMIKIYVTQQELHTFLTSNFYSLLYCNSEESVIEPMFKQDQYGPVSRLL
jgi:hypothetical protein